MEVKVFKLKEIKLLSGDVVDVEQYCNVHLRHVERPWNLEYSD